MFVWGFLYLLARVQQRDLTDPSDSADTIKLQQDVIFYHIIKQTGIQKSHVGHLGTYRILKLNPQGLDSLLNSGRPL